MLHGASRQIAEDAFRTERRAGAPRAMERGIFRSCPCDGHGWRLDDAIAVDVDVVAHVERGGNPEELVEAVMCRSIRDPAGVVDPVNRRRFAVGGAIYRGSGCRSPSQAEMPLADAGGVIARIAEQRWQRDAARFDERVAVPPQHAARHPSSPRVSSGEQGIARRRAHGRCGVGVGESQPFARQPIEVRRRDAPGRVERSDIAVAEIVSEDQDDIRPRLRRGGGNRSGGGNQGGDEVAHPRILHRSRESDQQGGCCRLGPLTGFRCKRG